MYKEQVKILSGAGEFGILSPQRDRILGCTETFFRFVKDTLRFEGPVENVTQYLQVPDMVLHNIDIYEVQYQTCLLYTTDAADAEYSRDVRAHASLT